jgi:hypothetical protein
MILTCLPKTLARSYINDARRYFWGKVEITVTVDCYRKGKGVEDVLYNQSLVKDV